MRGNVFTQNTKRRSFGYKDRTNSFRDCCDSWSRVFVKCISNRKQIRTDRRTMLLSRVVQMSAVPHFAVGFARFYSKPSPYLVKVGIPEFLTGIGKGVEAHVAKIETEIGDFHKLLETRTLKLKKLGIPCKQRKLILKYSHKYRLGLWRPSAEPVKS